MINTRNIIIAAASLLAIASPAYAEDFTVNGRSQSEDTPVVHVGFADLNLTSQPGQKSLHYRVGRAIRTLCTQEGVRDLGRMSESNRCDKLAWESATPQIQTAVDRAVAFAANPNGGKLAMSSITLATPAR